jgi:Glu-tRNA(Gln) amidotransferase subunit E-like FAD-binding protein
MENTIRQRVNQIRDEQKHSLAATARTRIMGRPLVDMLERVVRNNNIMQGYQVTDDFDDRRVSSSSSSSEDASVTPCFEALYEDVVLKSKIPQLIATTGGKLIACKIEKRVTFLILIAHG